ncbi:MAG: hypothetical protein JST00_42075 [Deltaproteobacteria bacterium]|nr:hypothetical protein [Deltaproteobacteria bacterium]
MNASFLKNGLAALAMLVVLLAPLRASAEDVSSSSVVVHVSTPRPVTLTMHDLSTDAWTPVCESPCNGPLPTGAEYRVLDGDPPHYGEPFVLEPSATGAVTVEHRPRAKRLRTIGTVLVAAGVPLTLVSTAFVVGLATTDVDPNSWGELIQKSGIAMFSFAGGVGILSTVAGALCLSRGAESTKVVPTREATWVAPTPVAPPLPPTVKPINLTF